MGNKDGITLYFEQHPMTAYPQPPFFPSFLLTFNRHYVPFRRIGLQALNGLYHCGSLRLRHSGNVAALEAKSREWEAKAEELELQRR